MGMAELVSPGLLLQAGGYLLFGGIAFGVLRSRVEEIGKRQIEHETEDDRRFNAVDGAIQQVHKKLTSVGEDVAEIKGMLKPKQR